MKLNQYDSQVSRIVRTWSSPFSKEAAQVMKAELVAISGAWTAHPFVRFDGNIFYLAIDPQARKWTHDQACLIIIHSDADV